MFPSGVFYFTGIAVLAVIAFIEWWRDNKGLNTETDTETHVTYAWDGQCTFNLWEPTKNIPIFCGKELTVVGTQASGQSPCIYIQVKDENGTYVIEDEPFITTSSMWLEENAKYAGMIIPGYSPTDEIFYIRMFSGLNSDGTKAVAWTGWAGQPYTFSCRCKTDFDDLEKGIIIQKLNPDFEQKKNEIKAIASGGGGVSYTDDAASETKKDPSVIIDTIIDDVNNNLFEGTIAEQPDPYAIENAVSVKQAIDILYTLLNGEEEDTNV